MYDDLVDLLIKNFEKDKMLKVIAHDYQHQGWMLVKERFSGSADPRRLAALNILLRFELKLRLEKLVED